MMAKPASEDRRPVRATPARQPVDSDNLFLYHSTTRRDHFDQLVSGVEDVDEVLLWNTRGEVTGSTTSNLVVEMDGVYYTPPVGNGVRAGTCRANLMQQGRLTERPILLEELKNCTKVYLINSQIGWREVVLV
jgi:para-aminobenzoate synthetase/4-amino-4-deoxychorismate lyase